MPKKKDASKLDSILPLIKLIGEGAVVFFVCMAVLALIQLATPTLTGNDGYFHIKMTYLMRTEGLIPDFDWLPLSILNAEEFVDHHFLFHIFQLPFTFGDLRLGAKISTVVFASLAFLAVWHLLKSQRVAYAWLWTLGLLGISDAFLYRMAQPRRQTLSLAAIVLGTHWLMQKKYWHVFILGALYLWLYDGFPLFIILAATFTLAVWLNEGKLLWQPLAYSIGGVAAGFIASPYFPKNVVFTFRHILPKVSDATSISVGNEWYPYDTGDLLNNSWATLAFLAAGLMALVLLGKRSSTPIIFSTLLLFPFGFLLMQSRRFIEYFPAIVLIFAALSISAWLDNPEGSIGGLENLKKRLSAESRTWLRTVSMVGLVLLIWFTTRETQGAMPESNPYDRYAGAALWLQENTVEKERVFHTDWDDFPELFYFNHHNTYLLGLDPTYMQQYDEDLYDTWRQISLGNVAQPGSLIQDLFGARYAFSDIDDHFAFIRAANSDPGMRLVYEDEWTMVFEVIQGTTQSGDTE